MKTETIRLAGLSCFEAEEKIAERYGLGEVVNSSSFDHRLKLGAHDYGMVSAENGSLEFSYVVDKLNGGDYMIRIFPKGKTQRG